MTLASFAATLPAWQSLYQEQYQVHDFKPLRIDGQIPQQLNGIYAQNGPRNIEQQDNLVLAESLIRVVQFKQGQAYGALFELDDQQPARTYNQHDIIKSWRKKFSYLLQGRAPVKNVASTSLMLWQKKWLALYEVARPTQVTLPEFSSLGESDLEGIVHASFSAHPHYIESRAVSFNFGTRLGLSGTWLDIYQLPDQGKASRLISINLKRHCLGFIHDFAVTDNYLIFVIPAININLKEAIAIASGQSPFDAVSWRSDLSGQILIVPIDRPEQYRFIQCPAFFPLHFANAFEQDNKLVMDYGFNQDTNIYKLLGRIHKVDQLDQLKQEFSQFMQAEHNNGRLQRCIIDAANESLSFDFLTQQPIEFPRINQNYQGQHYRYVYCLANDYSDRVTRPWFSRFIKLDVITKQESSYQFPSGHLGLEPCFVPAENVRAEDNAEGQGFLLAFMLDTNNNNSYLAIFDAQQLEAGPIAKVHFDQPLPIAFHGIYVADQID